MDDALTGDSTGVYTYKDIVYVVNEITGEEVTSYSVPLEYDSVPITAAMLRLHKTAQAKMQTDGNSWLSNTVLVIDTSGSMKTGDG
jgi:hypothetical protein